MAVDPGDRSGAVLRPLAEGRGRLVPVAKHERRYAGEREYRGLTVPISLAGEPAAALRQLGETVEDTIGPAGSGVTVFGGNRCVLALRSAERLTVEGWFEYFSPGEDQGWSQRLERTVRSWTPNAGGSGEVDGE
ncbi:hypothetical protein [Nonomuraea sp. NPDC049750]|uniref:hypothetical protein n=1 Tax=Nonomuraea sp. NPDC049750 TaxID=3154738 RepID=UPI0034051EDA